MSNNSLYNSEWLKGEYKLEISAYYYREWKDFQMPSHEHDRIEIMYVMKGSCIVDVMDHPLELKTGDMILIDSMIPHQLVIEKDEPCRMLNIEFTFKRWEMGFPAFNAIVRDTKNIRKILDYRLPYVVIKDSDEVYPALWSLIVELNGKNHDREYLIQLLFSQLFIRLANLICTKMENKEDYSGLYSKKLIHYMHHNYDKPLAVDQLAAYMHLHPNYLHRIFKAETGKTIMGYLTEIRIEKAKMLLEQTDILIIDLSGYIGINSRQYFSYVFKKHTGMSPLEYKKSRVIQVSE